jgi:D-alanyl-D-alanine dipeptidase
MKRISDQDLIIFDKFQEIYPVRIDLVYAKPDHPENLFGSIYHRAARMVGHKDLAAITFLAAKRLFEDHGWRVVIKDCLRPIEAQALMCETDIVKAHPHWLQEPRFLSSPGQGGHPRGMAIDLTVEDEKGAAVDMGTVFDHFGPAPDEEVNSAHRNYKYMRDHVRKNREILERAMVQAATDLGFPLLPLPQEWWDFRLPKEYTASFVPISDQDLPQFLKMMEPPDIEYDFTRMQDMIEKIMQRLN